jgi:hypothetical protein
MIGPAVDEAMEWYTRPNWIGVSTAPSAFFLAEHACSSGESLSYPSLPLTRWKVPMHGGDAVESWALDWPLDESANMPALDEKGLLALFAGKPIGPEALSKYTNTLAFFRARKAEQQKLVKSATSTQTSQPTP